MSTAEHSRVSSRCSQTWRPQLKCDRLHQHSHRFSSAQPECLSRKPTAEPCKAASLSAVCSARGGGRLSAAACSVSCRKELAEAHKTNKPCGKCCFYLLISKTFVEAGKGSSKKKRSSQKKEELMFANAEEEFFYEVRLSRFTRLDLNKNFLRNNPGFFFFILFYF